MNFGQCLHCKIFLNNAILATAYEIFNRDVIIIIEPDIPYTLDTAIEHIIDCEFKDISDISDKSNKLLCHNCCLEVKSFVKMKLQFVDEFERFRCNSQQPSDVSMNEDDADSESENSEN